MNCRIKPFTSTMRSPCRRSDCFVACHRFPANGRCISSENHISVPHTGDAGRGKLPTATLSVSEGFVEIVDLAELEVYHLK